MVSGCVPGSGGRRGRIGTEEAVRVYLIRFIVDLPLRLIRGRRDLIEYL